MNSTYGEIQATPIDYRNESYIITFKGKNELVAFLIVGYLRVILTPVIITSGFVGNGASFAVFKSRRMKHSSFSTFFLSTLAMTDVLFLFFLFLTWLSEFIPTMMSSPIICCIFGFITYVTSFLSVWLNVIFSTERFIYVCFPLRGKYICTKVRRRLVVIVTLIAGCSQYLYVFWTTQHSIFNGHHICTTKREYASIINAMVWMDSFTTMVFPLLLTLVLNSSVIFKMSKWKTRSTNQTHRFENIKVQISVTKTLLLISFIFFTLHIPSHILRLHVLVGYFRNRQKVNEWTYIFKEISQLLYYFSFSVNIFIYYSTAKSFREVLDSKLRILRRTARSTFSRKTQETSF